MLSLVASWNEVFKGEYRYNSVKEAYDALKGEGFQFPELNSSEDIFDAARVRITLQAFFTNRNKNQLLFLQIKNL